MDKVCWLTKEVHGRRAAQIGKIQSDDPEEERKQKEFKSMLNKITLDNYETLRDKIVSVGISSAVTLRGLIDQARAPCKP